MLTEYLKYSALVIFFGKMWLALKSARCCVVAFDGSQKSQLVTVSA